MEKNRFRVHQALSPLERLTSRNREIKARVTQFISTLDRSLQAARGGGC